MNRKKKVISVLKKKAKKANAKLAGNNNKPRYISKLEREKLAIAEREAELANDSQASDELAEIGESKENSELREADNTKCKN